MKKNEERVEQKEGKIRNRMKREQEYEMEEMKEKNEKVKNKKGE
jgi:hypothetical protein